MFSVKDGGVKDDLEVQSLCLAIKLATNYRYLF